MVDVSNVIISGEWTLTPKGGVNQITIKGHNFGWLTDQQARDLASALQVWVERQAEVEL